MSLPRPVLGQAAQVLELDRLSVTKAATVSAGGSALVTFDQVNSDRFWLVDRLIVSSTSTARSAAYVYDDTPSNYALLGGTSSGNFDYDDSAAPYLIDSGKTLQVAWTGATPGATCIVRAQYRLCSRGGPG